LSAAPSCVCPFLLPLSDGPLLYPSPLFPSTPLFFFGELFFCFFVSRIRLPFSLDWSCSFLFLSLLLVYRPCRLQRLLTPFWARSVPTLSLAPGRFFIDTMLHCQPGYRSFPDFLGSLAVEFCLSTLMVRPFSSIDFRPFFVSRPGCFAGFSVSASFMFFHPNPALNPRPRGPHGQPGRSFSCFCGLFACLNGDLLVAYTCLRGFFGP